MSSRKPRKRTTLTNSLTTKSFLLQYFEYDKDTHTLRAINRENEKFNREIEHRNTSWYQRTAFTVDGVQNTISLHVLIYLLANDVECIGDLEIDHIDANINNNHPSNLRAVPSIINALNRDLHIPSKNKNGYKGVQKTKSGKYRGVIKVGGKLICSNLVETPEEAHDYYLRAKKIYADELLAIL